MSLIVYTKTGCPWCTAVIGFLNTRKIPYEEREVRGNKTYFDELVQKSGQAKTPTLDLDGEILADTDAAAVEKWLKAKNIIS